MYLVQNLWLLRVTWMQGFIGNWVLVLALMLLAGGGLWRLLGGDGIVVISIASAFLAVLALVWVAMLPNYLMVLASSKSLAFLANIHWRLLLILLPSVAILSLVLPLPLLMVDRAPYWQGLLVVYIGLSLYIPLAIVGAYYLGVFGVGAPIWGWIALSFLLPKGKSALILAQLPLLSVGVCGLWLCFAIWWLRLRPRLASGRFSRFNRLWFAALDAQRPQSAPTRPWFKLRLRAASLLGSLYAGGADGYKAELLRYFAVGLMMYLALWLNARVIAGTIGDGIEGHLLLLMLGFYLCVLTGAAGIGCRQYLKRLWLVFPGDRAALLNYMFKQLYFRLALVLLLGLVVYGVSLVLGVKDLASAVDEWRHLSVWLEMFVWFHLLMLWLYGKTQVGLNAVTFLNVGCLLVAGSLSALIIFSPWLWGWLLLLLLVAIGVTYQSVRAGWPQVQLRRLS